MSKIDKRLDPQKITDLTVADLARRGRFFGLVTMIDDSMFPGTTGPDGFPTVWYETDAATVARDYEFRTRTKPVEFDDIFRTSLPLQIKNHMTQGVRTTPEQERYDEIQYATDVLPPATSALANRLSSKIETRLLDTSNLKITNLSLGGPGTLDNPDAFAAQLLRIQVACNRAGMPKQGRYLLAGQNVFVALAASQLIRAYDTSQAETVFREGVAARLTVGGMELVDGTDLLGDNEFQVVHPSWAVMPTGPGQLPDSNVAWARLARIDGVSARVQRGYSLDYDRNGQVIHVYWNIEEIKDEISRHTRASAESAADGSVAGDPIIENDALVTTGKSVRRAKGTFAPLAPAA